MTRERDIEKYLVERVKALGGEVRKVKWIGRAGAPDRVVMLPPCVGLLQLTPSGRFDRTTPPQTIWVELKAPGKPPTEAQAREHERMRAMGQRVVVVDSFNGVDWLLP